MHVQYVCNIYVTYVQYVCAAEPFRKSRRCISIGQCVCNICAMYLTTQYVQCMFNVCAMCIKCMFNVCSICVCSGTI